MIKICICGGGSLGHVCAGILSSQKDVSVNIFTQHPERWNKDILINDLDGKVYKGHLNTVSNQPQETIAGCDIIFLCLPGFAIEETLSTIKSFVGKAVVGSIVCSTGFFFFAHKILGDDARLFGFQRTPFIARTVDYGSSANLLGYKKEVAIATENIEDRETFRKQVERLFLTPTKLLSSFFEVSLTNSNPILHTGRLYSMWKNWKGDPFDHNILFYKEWTIEASQTIIAMDNEFMHLLENLQVKKDAIPPLLEYYESYDAESLRQKISQIPAFQNITSPMKQVEGGWIPDFQSRYFTEDFPYGLAFIHNLAHERGVTCPTIDKVYEWGMNKCCK